jgi:hypothetical protein
MAMTAAESRTLASVPTRVSEPSPPTSRAHAGLHVSAVPHSYDIDTFLPAHK